MNIHPVQFHYQLPSNVIHKPVTSIRLPYVTGQSQIPDYDGDGDIDEDDIAAYLNSISNNLNNLGRQGQSTSSSPILLPSQQTPVVKIASAPLLPLAMGVGSLGSFLAYGAIRDLWLPKDYSPELKKFVDMLLSDSIYTPQQINKIAGDSAYNWLKNLKGKDLREHFLKILMVKHMRRYHPYIKNWDRFVDDLIRNTLIKKAQLAAYMMERSVKDNDGTLEFKDFANVSGADQSMHDKTRTAGNIVSELKNKERGLYGLDLTLEDFKLLRSTLMLVDLGVFDLKEIARAHPSPKKHLIDIFTQWSNNEKEAFQLPSDAYRQFAKLNGAWYINTARSGVTHGSTVSIIYNELFGVGLGDDITRELQTFANNFAGFGGTNNYTSPVYQMKFGVYGMGGLFVEAGERRIPSAMFQVRESRLVKLLEESGFPEAIIKLNPRVVETKSPATEFDMVMLKELDHEINLRIVKDLKGKKFSELSKEVQRRLVLELAGMQIEHEVEQGTLKDSAKKDGKLKKQRADAIFQRLEGENPVLNESNLFSEYKYLLEMGAFDAYKKAKIHKTEKHTVLMRAAIRGTRAHIFPQTAGSSERMPYIWAHKFSIIMGHAMTWAHSLQIQGHDPHEAIEYIFKHIRKINDEDVELVSMPTEIMNPDGTITGNAERAKRVAEITKKVRENEFEKVPVSTEYYEAIERAMKDPKAGIKEIEKIYKKAQTIELLCVTAHTLDNALRKVYMPYGAPDGTIRIDENRETGFSRDEKDSLGEQGKRELLTPFFELEDKLKDVFKAWKNPDGTQKYECVFSIDSAPIKVNVGRKALFKIVNNASGISVVNMFGKEFRGIKEIEQLFTTYLECSMIELIKESNMPSVGNLTDLNEMQGDSMSDMQAQVRGLLERVLGKSRSVRGMIDEYALTKAIVDQLCINDYRKTGGGKVTIGIIDAAKKRDEAFLLEGSPNEKLARNQILANPFRYEIYYAEGENKDKAVEKGKALDCVKGTEYDLEPKYLDSVGGVKVYYKIVGKGSEKLFKNTKFTTRRQLQKFLDPYIKGIFLRKWIKADDVDHNHLMDFITHTLTHGIDEEVSRELIENPHLQKKLLEEGLGLIDRNGFQLGMPFETGLNPEKWQPKLRKGKNVYDPVHWAWLHAVPSYIATAQAGGILALAASIPLAGIALKKYLDSRKHKHEIGAKQDDKNNNFGEMTDEDKKKYLNSLAWQNILMKGLWTGNFMLNAAFFTKNILASQYPRLFLASGSLINMTAPFLPSSVRLPVAVLGTALSTGGWAVNQTLTDQANVDLQDPEYLEEMIKSSKYSDDFPDKKYRGVDANGKEHGYGHILFPGTLATLDRQKYQKTFDYLYKDLKLPSAIASSGAGMKQVFDMNLNMLKDWRYAHDCLSEGHRKEFVRSTPYKMSNYRASLLAVGSAIPVAALTLVGGVQLISKLVHHKPDDQKTKKKKTDDDDQTNPQMEAAAELSAIVPSYAIAKWGNMVKLAGFGNPYHILPTGTNMQIIASPRLNGNLMIAGGYGSMALAGISALSSMGLISTAISSIVDPLFIGIQSGMVGVGQSRFFREAEFVLSQSSHFFPKQGPIEHAKQIAQAQNEHFMPKGLRWIPGIGNKKKLEMFPRHPHQLKLSQKERRYVPTIGYQEKNFDSKNTSFTVSGAN